MLRRLWLLFAQATTVGLAALFIVATLRPEWLRGAPPVVSTPVSGNVSIQQVALSDSGNRPATVSSYADAARRAMGAVVSVYVSAKKLGCEMRLINMTRQVAKLLGGTPDQLGTYIWDHWFGEPEEPTEAHVQTVVQFILDHPDLDDEAAVQAARRVI